MVRMRRGAVTLLLLCGVVFGTFGKPLEPEMLVQYAEQLDLTDLQRSTLRKVAVEARKTSILTEAQIRVTELGIQELLEQDTLDLSTIETEMGKLAELQTQMRMVRIRAMVRMQDVLSPEQLKRAQQIEMRLERARREGRQELERLATENRELHEAIRRFERAISELQEENRRLRESAREPR